MARKLTWMGIQAAMFALAALMQWDMARETGQPFNFGGWLLFGFIGAFGVTALWFDARPRLVAWVRRMVSPPPAVLRDANPGPIGFPAVTGHDGQPGREGQGLVTSGRGRGDGPKVISGGRVG